jgi:glycosyltransferase involved in cell wall biosynthesis
MRQPFFSVIIPTYHRAGLLLDTLKSIQAQTFGDFECIVVDDGGRDHTEQVVKSLEDDRFRYYWKENGERGAARNYGAALANGKWLNFFDSDDLAYDFHLEQAFSEITKNETLKSFYFGLDKKFSTTSHVIKHRKVTNREEFLRHNPINPNVIFINREVFEDLKFSEIRSLSGTEDWHFILRLVKYSDFVGFDSISTAALVFHDSRSMVEASGDSTLARTRTLMSLLEDENFFDLEYQKFQKSVSAEMISLSSLQYALEGKVRESLRFLLSSLILKPSLLFSRRFLAIVKHILKSFF